MGRITLRYLCSVLHSNPAAVFPNLHFNDTKVFVALGTCVRRGHTARTSERGKPRCIAPHHAHNTHPSDAFSANRSLAFGITSTRRTWYPQIPLPTAMIPSVQCSDRCTRRQVVQAPFCGVCCRGVEPHTLILGFEGEHRPHFGSHCSRVRSRDLSMVATSGKVFSLPKSENAPPLKR